MKTTRSDTASETPADLAAIVWRRMRRQHLAWGLTAFVGSFLLHMLLLWWFPGFDIRDAIGLKPAEPRRPIRVNEIRVAPEKSEAASRPMRFRPDAVKAVGPGEEAGTGSAESRHPLDLAGMEPRDPGPGVLVGEVRNLREPEPAERPLRQPREDILQIRTKVADDKISALPRRYTPGIRRLSGAPDIVQPSDRGELAARARDTSAPGTIGDPSQFDWGRPAAGGGRGGGLPPVPKEAPHVATLTNAEERALAQANLKRLDKLLRADVFAYRAANEPDVVYGRIEIKRRGDDVLPVLAKDVLLVQDASASITEQKLHFCREGLTKALEQLGPEDRFNVVEFRDRSERCFQGWAPVNPDTLERAREFVARMEATGNTDIFASMKELLDLPREPGRPVIVQAISDGVATVGVTDRSIIIEAFSAENRGQLSVFTLGTYPGANAYLLDLLSYRNRGDTAIVRTGRWDIPGTIEARARSVARPVLNDVRFRFSAQTGGEVLPRLTSNLYLDRPLVLFARYPREARRLVFRATGQAGDVTCDMVFDVDLTQVETGDGGIRTQWAWQKVYDLIGEHNRTQSGQVLRELRALGKRYGIRIPYRDELRD